jgi:hypothetical protein
MRLATTLTVYALVKQLRFMKDQQIVQGSQVERREEKGKRRKKAGEKKEEWKSRKAWAGMQDECSMCHLILDMRVRTHGN